MGYGANANRVPADGVNAITAADLFRVFLIGKTERGVAEVLPEAFNLGDFTDRFGRFSASKQMAFEALSFYETLEEGVNAQIIGRSVVASDAVQATATVVDGTPNTAYNLKASYRGKDDKSAFGNKVARKLTVTEDRKYELSADAAASQADVLLKNLELLKVGHLLHLVDGGNDEHHFIQSINFVTKTVTFEDNIVAVGGFTAAGTVVTRVDVNIEIAVLTPRGSFERKENFEGFPFQKSIGDGSISEAMSNVKTGSKFMEAVYDVANTSTPVNRVPVADTDFVLLTSGSDGTPVGVTEINAAVADFADLKAPVLISPELATVAHHQNMLAFTNDGEKAVYYAGTPTGADEDTLKALGSDIRAEISFGMIPQDKRVKIENPDDPGTFVETSGLGIAAGHLMNTISARGIGKVAAGNKNPVNTLSEFIDNTLIHDDKGGKGQRLIEDHSVNISRFTRGRGITINSARTLSTDKGYIFQNQLIGFWFLRTSIVDFLKIEAEQEQAGVRGANERRNIIISFARSLFDVGVFFQGQKEDGSLTKFEDVFKVVNDFTINTLADIANGIETALVEVIFTPPVEKPTLNLASAPVTKISS